MPQTSFTIRRELLNRVNNMAKQTQRSTSEQLEVLVELAADAWESGGFKEAATGPSLDAKQTLNLIGETAHTLVEIFSLLDQKTLTKIQEHFEEKEKISAKEQDTTRKVIARANSFNGKLVRH